MAQTVDTSIRPFVRMAEHENRRADEAQCRNVLLSYACELDTEYFAMMDDDVALPSPNCLERAVLQLLNGGESLGAVHICPKGRTPTGHFDIGCVVMRRTAACTVVFDTRIPADGCHCSTFGDRLRAFNFRQEWLNHAYQEACK